MRRRHYSIRTERSYCQWVNRFILHFNMKSRNDLSEGEKKIERYLTFLARDRDVASSTENQALNALVFFYKHVLKQPLNDKMNAERAAKKVKIPVVLTRDETKRIIGEIGDRSIMFIFSEVFGSGDVSPGSLPIRSELGFPRLQRPRKPQDFRKALQEMIAQ